MRAFRALLVVAGLALGWPAIAGGYRVTSEAGTYQVELAPVPETVRLGDLPREADVRRGFRASITCERGREVIRRKGSDVSEEPMTTTLLHDSEGLNLKQRPERD